MEKFTVQYITYVASINMRTLFFFRIRNHIEESFISNLRGIFDKYMSSSFVFLKTLIDNQFRIRFYLETISHREMR